MKDVNLLLIRRERAWDDQRHSTKCCPSSPRTSVLHDKERKKKKKKQQKKHKGRTLAKEPEGELKQPEKKGISEGGQTKIGSHNKPPGKDCKVFALKEPNRIKREGFRV